MYEAVPHAPDGPTTPARFLRVAGRYGFDGLVYWLEDPDIPLALGESGDMTVATGYQFEAADRSTTGQTIDRVRDLVDVLAVYGPTRPMRRFIAGQERVDVLQWPVPGDGPIDPAVAKLARENGVYVAVDLSTVLRSRGGRRVKALDTLTRSWSVLAHYEVPYVMTGAPTTHLELRAPREVAALGPAFAAPETAGKVGLAAWGEVVARTRHQQSDTFIEPGVERIPDETVDR